MFIAALFTIAKYAISLGVQPMAHIHSGVPFNIKNDGIMPFVGKWMELGDHNVK
jgi:hypothetical protein